MLLHFFLSKIARALFRPPDATKSADQLVRYTMRLGFRTFRDPEFRRHVEFTELSTGEQDRMFNELMASNLVLATLMTDTFAKLANRGVSDFFRAVCTEITERFSATLRGMGIAEEHACTWIKLLELRRDEYEDQRLYSRSSLPEFGEGNPWLRVVAVGCLFHIRRGKPAKDDPLFPIFIRQAVAVSECTRRVILRATRRL